MTDFQALVDQVRKNDAERREYAESCTQFLLALTQELREQAAAISGQFSFDLSGIRDIENGVMSVPMEFTLPVGNTVYSGQRAFLGGTLKLQVLDSSVYFLFIDDIAGTTVTSVNQGVQYVISTLTALDNLYTKEFLE